MPSDIYNTIEILGDEVAGAQVIDKTISEFKDNTLAYIGSYAFTSCQALSVAEFPNAMIIYQNAFANCGSLSSVSFPNASRIENSAFYYCSSLSSASFPSAAVIGSSAFFLCTNLTSITIGTRMNTVCILSSSNAFLKNGVGSIINPSLSIYVPSSLAAAYKIASNWSYFSTRIVGV